MSPNKSLFGKKKIVETVKDYPLPPSCSVSNLTEFLADGNASFLRAARSGNLEKVIEFLKGTIDINTSNANGLNALHLAAKEGHVNVVTELIKRGANVNAATKKGNTALHIASLAGQEEVVKVLVKLGANVNVQSQNGFTPLYMAAQENHDAVVSFLLANGANQSLATEDGFTPLAVALQQGHDKVVAVLLENDTKGKVRLPALHIAAKKDDCKAATLLLQSDHNPDVTSKSGFTPLHIAAHYGNENIAKILLSKGADVNYAAKHQITPLHVASKWGKINMVTLLLEKGANIDASTRDGLTPLHCAARSGHDQVVDLLLEKGAPFLAKTKNGLAPLHMASQGDHVDSARILLYHKAPVDDVTVDYLTALHVAAHCGHVKVAKLLLDRKADPNARALNGFTPLHIACKKNRIKVVELLLKHGASIEATTESGLTPLHVASFMGCMNIVIYLIQNGSNPDVPTVRGETPLHLAARANQTDIIRILLRNGASVDARAREEQTPLHIAARLGNVDIVSLLLQHGAAVDAVTKDMYTPLHITAKEDQEEVAAALLDHGASLTATTKKGFTPLHLAAKYGNIKVARLLLQKGAPVDAQGKNGVTPLHVAAHYDHVNVALLLLDKGASPHAMAKNGYTPLHIAAKKNQMDIASTLLEYGANTNSESKAGFTPLHLSAQEGHADMSSLLIENKANVNHKANNGLTPLHLCAQDDRVNVAQVLVKNGAEICPQTKAGYTPLHVASHFGQINMVRFLLQNDANVHTVTSHGYTPLHQAAQQGHTLVVNLLLENQASPNVTTVQGQTPLSIAQRLGYISVVETLKVVTETTVTTTTTTVTEEKYKVVAPETMQETFMTDSEDEGGADFDEAAIFGKPTHATHIYLPYVEGQNFYMSEEAMLGDQSYRYLTADEMKSLGDDSLPIDVTKDEKQQDAVQAVKQFVAPMVEEDNISPQHGTPVESGFSEKFSPDNIDLVKAPVHAGMDDAYYYLPPKGMLRSSRLKWKTFLVSFMVDARGGAMRGCRHSGVRVIIPPRKASMPMRITCRYLRKEKLIHPPPLMEGEACASRILEMGPVGARFLGPVIIEVPHFASTRGKEREITILRSDTGESWREHTLEASEEAVQEVLNESFEGEELSALEDLNTNRITRILTTDFPQYFAIVTRIRQEVHGVGPEGGMVSSTVVPQVQAIFPEGALTKKIRVGLQAQPIAPELVTKLLGNRVAVSPIVTVEPRRRKFHKPITLTIPVPQAATKGMINQYSGDAPTLRLLCSITGSTKSGGSSKAQWEDVTGSTPLTFVNDCVSFTTTVSARFWLMDCRQVNEVTRFATELYQEAVYVPFMSKFVIFAKRHDPFEAQLRVFCMTDDKEDKTLESQEHFTEVAKSRDVEVLEGKLQYLEFAGNLVPVTKSGEQLKLTFQAFHENRLPFIIRVKDPHAEHMGRIAFMKEPKAGRGEPPQTPICNLNVALPDITLFDSTDVLELVTLEKRYDFIQEAGLSKPELIHRADLRLSDIARELDKDWILLAQQLDVQEQDVEQIKAQTICDQSEQARMMLRLWLHKSGPKATGNELEKGLRKINREDIIKNCMFNVELVTDDVEKAVAKVHLDQSGFDVFKEELGSSREASMRRGTSLDDEQDIMKEAESAAETSSETGSLFERDHLSQALSDERDEFAMLSVHETALSDTDAPFNSNKPAFDDSNNILKSLNNCNFDEDISKSSNYDSYSSEGNTLLFSQTSGKMHDFWPPGMIIQTPLAVSEISDISSPDKFEDALEKESALNDSFQSNIAFESDMPSELKASLTDNESFVDTKEILSSESVDYNNIINTSIDVSIDNPYESSEFNFSIKTDEPNSNSYENKYDEEVEYVASLEPDVEIADESIDNFMPSDINYKSGSKGVIIEEVPSSNGSEPGESRFLFQSPGISCPMSGNNNKFPSLDAEQNLYPIEENERDECDAVTEPGTTYETSLNESLNSYNIMQNELNNISSVSIDSHDKIYNGFKHETSTEASDLGYFSLDKDSSLSSTSAISEEKIKQLESELFSSIFEDKNRLNEKISVSILPEISGDIQSTMKVFVDKEEGKLKYGELDEYNTQIAIDKDKLQDISFKSSDACIKEENKIVKNEEYSYPKDAKIRRASKTPPPSPIDETVDKGGIELEKLQEISNLLPEVIESEVQKPEESDFRKVEVIVKEHVIIQEIPSKLTESETWQSGDLDTSQVSVSSLPEDDKSEPTTTTVSSTAVQEITKSVVPDTEPDEDLEDETLSPIKFKEDLCSKKVSPTKSIFGSNIFMSPKMPSSVQLTPEKILCLQELSLSPVKEDAEIETKETCTSPCSDKLETVKPNQLISTRKGFRTRKRLSPIHDGNKMEQKLPSRVDKGLSPIAVLTAGPSGVEEEGSEYFVQTYDAPAMQEPIPSSSMFCSKSTEMSPKSIFEKDASKSSISKILLEKDQISSKSVDGQKADFSIELTQISKSVISDKDNEEQIITDVKSSIKTDTIPVKVEKSTSPLSDIMLDTGIGTDSPLTADTASSPFFPETLSPSSLSLHSAAQFMKENSSTQTIQVEMLSAHTSPIDGPFSLQESNISCCGTESSLKSDSLDDISRTLGTPSSDIGLDLHYSPQNQSKDPSKPSVKEFLEEHTASDAASDVMEAEDVSSCSSHEIVLKTDLPSYITDRETVDKMLVIESFRNVFATEPPFSVVVPQHKGSPKRHSDYGKKRRSLVSSEASSDDRIFSLHDQLLSEESALESSTDSGVDLKESSQGFVTYTTTVHASMSIDKQETKIFADESISHLKMTEKTTYETPVTEHELKSGYYEKEGLLFKSSGGIPDDYVEEVFKDEIVRSENISTSVSEIKSKDDQGDIIPDYVNKVEKEISSSSATHISDSPVHEINTFYMQQIFQSSSKEDNVENKVNKLPEKEDINSKPVDETVIVPIKLSLSFDSELKHQTLHKDIKSSDCIERVGKEIHFAPEEFSPTLEVDVVEIQKGFQVIDERSVITSSKIQDSVDTKSADGNSYKKLKSTSSLEKEIKTSPNNDGFIQKDSYVHAYEHNTVPGFIEKVEEEILRSQSIISCISPIAEMSSVYAQEIFQPCVSEEHSSISDKPEAALASDEPVEEKPVVPVKASLSFDSVDTQSSLEKEMKTSSEKEKLIQKEGSVHSEEQKTVPGFIEKVEDEILCSQAFIPCISPVAEMSSIYAQEIFDDPVSEDKSSISVKPDSAYATSEPVEEKPVIPVKTSLSFDAVDTQIFKEFSSRPNSLLEKEIKTSSNNDSFIQKQSSAHADEHKAVSGFIEKVEEEIIHSQTIVSSISPAAEMSSVYAQDIFEPSVSEDKSSISVKPDSVYATSEPVEEKPVIPVKTSLSFDTVDTQNIKEFSSGPHSLLEKEVKTSSNKDSFIQKQSSVYTDEHKVVSGFIDKVEEEILHSQTIVSCISPAAEMSSVYAQEIFEPSVSEDKTSISVKPDTTYATDESVQETAVISVKASLSFDTDDIEIVRESSSGPHSLLEKEIKTLPNKDSFIQKQSSVHAEQHKAVSGFIDKVEEEILHSQTIVSGISPVAEMSSVYAQEIFEPSVSEDKTSISVKPDATYATDESVQETPVIPVKASLSFDAVDINIRQFSSRQSSTLKTGGSERLESTADYVSEKETFSNVVDRIFSSAENDNYVSKPRTVDDIFVAEATVIKDKRNSLCLSDSQKISPKLEQSTSTDTTVEEIMDVDKSGTTTHIIQKTTHMTLVSHATSDTGSAEGELQGDIPVESVMDEETSPHSPDLSFAEKRDFFQKLSLSSSSPSVTPTHTSKTNIETEIKLLPVTDNIANLEVSPEEQLSFVERVKFFENAAEKHTVQTVQTIMPEVKEIKKEVWTVSENEMSEPKSSVYSDETYEKEREIETIEVLEETSCISAADKGEVSSPLYVNKEVLETTFDTNKDAKVEVMVKKFSPGTEMFEICSVENISKPQEEHLAEATDAICRHLYNIHPEETLADKKEAGETTTEEKVLKHEILEKISTEVKQEIDVPKSEDTDQPETDEEYISKTFKAVTESSYEASRSTVGAFKKGINEKLENKWQRESPDNISIVKETMEPSLGKSEIFICTEETLDNVKKILSVADAESNIVVPENETTPVETQHEGTDNETLDDSKPGIFICTEETLDNVKKILSVADAESNIIIPETEAVRVEKLQEGIDSETLDSKSGKAVEEVFEKADASKIEVAQVYKEKIKSKEDHSKVSKIIDESSMKIEQNISTSYEIATSKELIKDSEMKKLGKETELKVESKTQGVTSKEFSDEIEISKELAKDTKIKELSKETEVKVKPKKGDEIIKKTKDEIEIKKELIKDTEIKEFAKETEVRIESKKDDEISKTVIDKMEITNEIIIDTEIKIEPMKAEISKTISDGMSKEMVKDIEIKETEVKELKKDDEISKKTCEEIEINKELIKDTGIKEFAKETEVRIEYKMDDKISKTVIDKIEITKELIKDTEIKIEPKKDDKEMIKVTEIKELVKETEVKLESKKDDEISKNIRDEIEFSKGLIKDTEVKELFKETEIRIESEKDDKISKRISDEIEISNELVKETKIKGFHTETEVKEESKEDEEISKKISDEVQISKELIKDTKLETEIKIEPVKDDELSKKISDETETTKKLVKVIETKELVKETEVKTEPKKDGEISKNIRDEFEISKEICTQSEKDSKTIQSVGITESVTIGEQNRARPDSIIVKSSVTHTSVQEIDATSKDKSLEADVKDMDIEVSFDKIETVDSKYEVHHGKISPISVSDKSDTSSAKSIEIEFVPVLEVSNDVKVSVEKTGHEALGTPCSFHKEMSIESQHSELEQSFEKRISDTEKKIPLTTFAAVEKAEYEEVEKSKKENIENIIFRESVSQKTTGKETVHSVEVTQFKKHSTEVYNVPSEKLKEKFSSKKIHIETSSEEKDSKSFVPQKLHQFLDSVTQSHDVALPSDVTPVHKRTVEWLDQTGDMMLKEGAIIDNVDNGLFEDRHPTLDDENQRRSSPTAESFDDKARVEQCDTDVMMQLLDFVSRNDIELAEVRTEDEAPDIEEDVSPSGEEEISSRMTYEEGKVDDKILVPENFDEKSDDYLRVSKSDNLQLSPLRSSFDSVTSPSKRDFSSDNIETVLETKHFIEEVKHEQIHPQSSLEVEVGSHDSDDYCHLEIEREIVPLSFVEEEESAKMESKHSSREEKFSKLEDIKQYAKETATASIVIDSAGKSSTDLNENEDKSKHPEEIKGVSGELEMTAKSSELPKSELDAAVGSTQAISETEEKLSGAHVEALHPETDTVESEELCKITKDVYISEKDSNLMTETQHTEKSVSNFTSCAFINTAFAGADAIDEVDQVSPVRARSPYEVIRGKDDHVSDVSPDDKSSLSTSDRVTYVTKHVEMRRRPLLQHIPSEISEEDLVEREIISPIHELELSDQQAESESGILRFDTSDVSGIKTIPLETKVSEVSTYTVVKNVSVPVAAEDKIVKNESSDVTVVKTVTVTKVEHVGYADQSSDYQYIESIKDRPGDIQIQGDISEILAKDKDITTPESDTGIPTSEFELVSESELSDIEHKFSTSALSHSSAKSEKGDKSKDSVITTTHTQSITDKTVSVSIPSSEEHKDSLTLNGKSETSKTEDVSHAAEHSTVNITPDDKPLTNGPGEVEYHPEYDYDGESISKKFGHVYTERSVYETPETDEEPKCHYSSVSDDVIDSEIREILSSDQQLEDIIERPVTPEPPRDDITDVGFVSRLKRPSDVEIEGLMREEGFAYSDDAPLSSPTSPDSKSGFAYGMHFEKYVIDEGEEAMDIDSDQFSEEKEPPYSYDMTFEHEPELEEDVPCYGDLYTHEEEDEDVLENGEKSKVLQKLNSKDSEFDILAGRKYFSKNVEIDELSMSSLQEFERLEAEIVSGRKSSVGSLDSLNGKQLNSKSGDHDDVSMSSLTEFERIEKECTEGDKIDPSMQESITQLSEIEEGHESQASEASQENKSDVGRMEDISLADDYSNQLENIEELILEVESKKTDELPFQIMMKQTQKTEQTGQGIEITSKEKQIDNKISDISKETVTKTSTVTQITKIPIWTTSKSLESSSLGDARDDLDQDSLRDELSLKPDSLIDDAKLDFQDSLHEERFDDADSLQENIDEMRDSLFEERQIEDDSLHEMDIMPDESSLSLEGSLPAIASLDSSKADEPIKLTITNLTDIKGIQPEIILGSETETFQVRQTQINISDFPRGADIMQSSTDSLEQSSSALAAFQIESESLMSSSLNSAITSGEDNTMVSSSDTIEPEGRITYRYEDIPVDDIEMLVRSGHRVIVDSEGNIQAHYEGKPCIETEEIRNTALGFHKDTTEIKLPPTTTVQVHSALTTVGYVNGRQDQEKHFHHTSGEEDYESFESSHFDPDVEVEEIQTTDEFGNTKIIRKIKKVSHTKTQFSSSSSPKNVEEQLKEFLREHTAGDKAGSAEEEIEEQKTTDEKGNVVVIRTVKRHIHTDPEVHSKTFTGPTADQQSKKFVETFQTLDPTEDVSEYEKVDEQGNVVRVTEKFVVTPKVHTVSFSGPDAHKQMEDYMKQWTIQSQNLGEFEGDQQRAMLPSLQTGRTFEQSETSAPSDSSEHLVQNVIGDTIVTKTLSSTFSADSSEKIEIPESSTSTTTISIETARSKSDSSEDKKSMPK